MTTIVSCTEVLETSSPRLAPTLGAGPAARSAFKAILRFLNALLTTPVLPYAALLEASVIDRMVTQEKFTEADPFSTELPFLSTTWPDE